MMFPYPSAEGLHVGNMFAFTGSDIYGRFKRLQGYDVFEPIGFDAFGIHSENYAIKLGINPGSLIPQNIANFRRQLRRIGGMFDWHHELSTTDPSVLQVDPVDLPAALQGGEGVQEGRGGQLVPERQDRARQRAGHQRPVRALRHAWSSSGRSSSGSSGSPSTPTGCWPISTTGEMDWSETTITAQRNWIGRSEGAEIDFAIGGDAQATATRRRRHPRLHDPARHDLRRDVLVLAPEHPLVDRLTTAEQRAAVEAYRKRRRVAGPGLPQDRRAREDRRLHRRATRSIRPPAGQIPIWIADYVLMEYGTGAIMAVPGHDERDFEFARTLRAADRAASSPSRTPTPRLPWRRPTWTTSAASW